MQPSLSFDRAAGFYDSTRELPEEVAARGVEAIMKAAGPGARILDVGTGSGRVSVPLLLHRADLIGCDISRKMMTLLRQKYPGARLVEADASRLPFAAGYFDAVTTCHVMHLVAPWQEALREYRRVLKPGGVYINIYTDRTGQESVGRRIMDFWESRVVSYGASTRRPGVEDEKELAAALLEQRAKMQQIRVARYSRSYTVQEVVDGIANRIHSSAWVVPDEVFAQTVRELRAWAAKEFADPNARFEEESVFMLEIARFVGDGIAPPDPR